MRVANCHLSAIILHHGLRISLLPFKLAKPEIAWIEVSSSARSKVERVWCWSWILLSTAASLKGPSKAQQSNLESHLEIGVFKSKIATSWKPAISENACDKPVYDTQFLACLSKVWQPEFKDLGNSSVLLPAAHVDICTRFHKKWYGNANTTHVGISFQGIPGIYRSWKNMCSSLLHAFAIFACRSLTRNGHGTHLPLLSNQEARAHGSCQRSAQGILSTKPALEKSWSRGIQLFCLLNLEFWWVLKDNSEFPPCQEDDFSLQK